MRALLCAALVVATLCAGGARGACYTFYHNLCQGPASCMCTMREACGTGGNATYATDPRSGGCAGECRTVQHNRCRGSDSCLEDAGPCGTAPPLPPPGPNAVTGFDFASRFTDTQLSCLKNTAGMSFGVVRAHHSAGGVDTNAAGMIQALRSHGFQSAMAYLFPCTTFAAGHGPADQVRKTVQYLTQNNAVPDRIWFDLEWNPDAACDWSATNKSYNCEFVSGLVQAAAQENVPFGVYSGHTFWSEYLSECTAASLLPLWYAAYDGRKSFQGWTPYGGWTAPSIKQYNDKLEPSQCGFSSLDVDFAPNGLP